MGDVVNLRKVRKSTARRIDQDHAAVNRLRYGRTMAQKKLERARDETGRHDVDQHRVEAGDER
jgi:hypothetical protein